LSLAAETASEAGGDLEDLNTGLSNVP